MLWNPLKGKTQVQHNTRTVGNTSISLSDVFVSGDAGTKGTVTELIASTSFDAYWVTVICQGTGNSATASQGSLDILIGAATEEVLIPDLLIGYAGGQVVAVGSSPKRWDFPLYIPAGSRISARACSNRISSNFSVCVFLYGGNGVPAFRYGTKVTTYGVSAIPNGTTVTPGASAAEGAWAQMTASTSEDHFALIPSFQVTGDTTTNLLAFAVDLGIGAAAAEEEIAQSYWFYTDANERMSGPHNSMPCFNDIPSGTRLTMRASCSGVLDGGYNGAIHAVS